MKRKKAEAGNQWYDPANHDKHIGSDFGIRKQKIAGKVCKTSLRNIGKENNPK